MSDRLWDEGFDGEERELPLFPLHVVLFPGMPLPLRIFEPRYHALIRDCLAGDRLFGIAMISDGPEAGGPAEVMQVGTSALIERVEPLGEDSLSVVTRGIRRFAILQRLEDAPYPRAIVRMLDEKSSAADPVLIHDIQETLMQFLHAVAQVSGEVVGELELPDDARVLGYVVGAVLSCPLSEKQRLLEAPTSARRLQEELPMLREEVERQLKRTIRKRTLRPFDPEGMEICPN